MKFELVRFGEHFRLVKGASYSSKNLVEESDTGLMTINAFHAGGGYKPKSEKPFLGEVRAEHLLANGDVLIAMTEQDEGLLGSPLVVHKARTDYEELLFSLDVAKAIATTGEIEPEFVFNVLRIPAFRKRAAYGDTGSTVQRLPYDAIGDFKIPKPSLPTQRAINRLAAAIDKKIWLNNRMADTLEQLSESVFKSWFIDFDPVRAKTAGAAPLGIEAETAALFPDSMEQSELGEIPAGWSVGTFVDFFNLVMGQSPPGSAYNSEGIGEAFFQGRAEFGERFPSQRLSSTLGNRRATQGDVLVSVRAPVGDQNQALVDCIIGRGLAAIRHKSGSQAYSYEFVRSIQGQLDFFNGQGSVFGSISKSDFESLQVLEPPDSLIQAFDSICAPIDELLRNLHVQNERLAAIRDALLPRLISGEVEIPEETLAE